MSYAHLTSEDRSELAGLRRAGLKPAAIAVRLSKDPSTIRRELSRNQTNNLSGYDARLRGDDNNWIGPSVEPTCR